MRLVDANVLLYAVNTSSPEHARARAWIEAALDGDEPIGFAWPVILAFLRLATHPAVFARPLGVEAAVATVRAILARPPATPIEPTARHLDVLAALLRECGTAGNLVSDAHLAALAIEYDAAIVSFDADFARYQGVRWERPS